MKNLIACGLLAVLCFGANSQIIISGRHRKIFSGGGGGGTWTLVQHVKMATACGATTSCTLSGITATGTNHLIVVGIQIYVLANASYRTVSAITGGGTYTQCTACTANYNATGPTSLTNLMYYTTASTSGATSIAITISGGTPSGSTVDMSEWSWSGSTRAYDIGGTANQTAGPTAAGIALTLSGSSDVICQVGAPTTSVTAITGGAFTSPAFLDIDGNDNGFACAANTTNGAAPTWTLGSSGQLAASAIAIKGS